MDRTCTEKLLADRHGLGTLRADADRIAVARLALIVNVDVVTARRQGNVVGAARLMVGRVKPGGGVVAAGRVRIERLPADRVL